LLYSPIVLPIRNPPRDSFGDLPRGLDLIQVGRRDIQDGDIRMESGGKIPRFSDVARLA
jgi:hypothetical protein